MEVSGSCALVVLTLPSYVSSFVTSKLYICLFQVPNMNLSISNVEWQFKESKSEQSVEYVRKYIVAYIQEYHMCIKSILSERHCVFQILYIFV